MAAAGGVHRYRGAPIGAVLLLLAPGLEFCDRVRQQSAPPPAVGGVDIVSTPPGGGGLALGWAVLPSRFNKYLHWAVGGPASARQLERRLVLEDFAMAAHGCQSRFLATRRWLEAVVGMTAALAALLGAPAASYR